MEQLTIGIFFTCSTHGRPTCRYNKSDIYCHKWYLPGRSPAFRVKMDFEKEEFHIRKGSYLGKHVNCTLMSANHTASDVTQVKLSLVGLPVN